MSPSVRPPLACLLQLQINHTTCSPPLFRSLPLSLRCLYRLALPFSPSRRDAAEAEGEADAVIHSLSFSLPPFAYTPTSSVPDLTPLSHPPSRHTHRPCCPPKPPGRRMAQPQNSKKGRMLRRARVRACVLRRAPRRPWATWRRAPAPWLPPSWRLRPAWGPGSGGGSRWGATSAT